MLPCRAGQLASSGLPMSGLRDVTAPIMSSWGCAWMILLKCRITWQVRHPVSWGRCTGTPVLPVSCYRDISARSTRWRSCLQLRTVTGYKRHGSW